jgi:hypothetical protein
MDQRLSKHSCVTTQSRIVLPTQNKKSYFARNRQLKTVVPKVQKQYVSQHLNSRIFILKEENSKISIGSGNKFLCIYALIKQAMFTCLCKQKPIILPLFDLKEFNNILLQKVSFYQLKEHHNQKVLNQDRLNSRSASFQYSYSFTLRPKRVQSSTNY